MSQHLLGINIQTLGNQKIDSDLIPTITIFQDKSGNYHFATGIEEIQTIILGMIPHLGNRYAHAQTFNIQILPGDWLDAYFARLDYARVTNSPRRRKTNPEYQKCQDLFN